MSNPLRAARGFNTEPAQKGSIVEVEIGNLAFGGRGIAKTGGMVVFIDKALPGDIVKARVTKRKPQYAEAEMIEIVRPSPKRETPRCAIFGRCGGCTWQNFDYEEQIRYKQQHVEEALRHIAGQNQLTVRPIIGSPEPWSYRNKMEYSFGIGADRNITIGFHRTGDYRHIEQVHRCEIQPEPLNDLLSWLTAELNSEAQREGAHFVPYDQVRHTGFLRHLVLRYSATNGEFLAAILTAPDKWRGAEDVARRLFERFPQCRGFIWGTNAGLSDVARVEKLCLQTGTGWIEEQLGDKRFRVSTFSFFQTNTPGAKLLYDAVKEFCELTGRETVLDAYCGTGTIGIYLSGLAEKVVGIELVREAVWDARFNAQLNGASNCTFLAGEMRDVLQTLPQTLGARFDRVVIDPPRGGMDKKSLRLLIGIGAPLLVYVSCNPATLARDAVSLSEAGYRLELVQPVDMFPHTWHVESVIKFRRKE